MLGFVIISKTKLKEIESDAYNRGFQVARSVGYSEPTFRTAIDAECRQPYTHGLTRNPQSVTLRTVTSDNTQAANKAVQEMHKRVDVAQRRTKTKSRRSRRASYDDPNLRLIYSGVLVEDFVLKHIGKMTTEEMVKKIVKDEGTHIRGYRNPIKLTQRTVEDIMARRLVWDEATNIFLNIYSRTHTNPSQGPRAARHNPHAA